MYKVAVLGDQDSIYGFAALGLDIYPVEETAEAAACLRRLAENGYAVVYITEGLAVSIEDEVDKLRSRPLPAVIPIPGISGNTGIGMRMVKKSVEQAVGSDII